MEGPFDQRGSFKETRKKDDTYILCIIYSRNRHLKFMRYKLS